MNPEEWELCPQLLDQFRFMVVITAPEDVGVQVVVVKQQMAFGQDLIPFQEGVADSKIKLTARINTAQQLLPQVTLSKELLILISTIYNNLHVDSL